jgi:hypothetical protein
MTKKDKKAKKRVDDENKLKTKISKLLRNFSEEYDVELVSIDIRKNYFYPDESFDTPMYSMDLSWKFDYLAH